MDAILHVGSIVEFEGSLNDVGRKPFRVFGFNDSKPIGSRSDAIASGNKIDVEDAKISDDQGFFSNFPTLQSTSGTTISQVVQIIVYLEADTLGVSRERTFCV